MNKPQRKGLLPAYAVAANEWLTTVRHLCLKYIEANPDVPLYPNDETEMGEIKAALESKLKDYLRSSISIALMFPRDVMTDTNPVKDFLVNGVEWDIIIDDILDRSSFYEFTLEYDDCTRELFGYKGDVFFIAHELWSDNISDRRRNETPMPDSYRLGFTANGLQVFSFCAKDTNPIALVKYLEMNFSDWESDDPITLSNLVVRLKKQLSNREFKSLITMSSQCGVVKGMDF